MHNRRADIVLSAIVGRKGNYELNRINLVVGRIGNGIGSSPFVKYDNIGNLLAVGIILKIGVKNFFV